MSKRQDLKRQSSWRPTLNPLFQLSTRDYDREIPLVRQALASLETECKVHNGYAIGAPFDKFGWTFFNIKLNDKLASIIEKSGMMKGALGYRIGEQMTNFVGHYLESKGSNVRIKKIEHV